MGKRKTSITTPDCRARGYYRKDLIRSGCIENGKINGSKVLTLITCLGSETFVSDSESKLYLSQGYFRRNQYNGKYS